MLRRHAVSKLIFVFAPLAVASLAVVMKSMGPRYWWFGFLLAQAIYLYMSESIFKGQSVFMRLGKDRVALNLRSVGVENPPKVLGYQWRFALVGCIVGFTFIATIQTDVQRGFEEIAHILRPEQLIARIEYPAWVEATPVEKRMDAVGVELQADTSSYFELRTKNLKSTTWSVTLAATPENSTTPAGAPLTVTVGREGSPHWGQSIATLYEMLGTDKTKKYSVRVVALDGTGEKYQAVIKVAPATLPVVTLMPAPDSNQGGPSDIAFLLSAQSRIPLTVVDLEARTKSGYRFSKTAVEVAGSSELLIKNTRAVISTLGIPFAEKDILYVKAVAKTIVSGVTGESPEIAIPVTSREELRRELAKQLEATLKLFENEKQNFANTKQNIVQNLASAQSMANSLGRQSFARKKLDEATMLANRMQNRNDAAAQAAKQRIRSVMEALKRLQAMQETASLFARMQSLRNNIQRSSKNELRPLASEAKQLSNAASGMQKKLHELSQEFSFGLTPDEKSAVQKLLRSDTTPQKLSEAAQSLDAPHKERAEQQMTEAISEAQKKLGGVSQILMGARQRAVKLAREQLTEADTKLQQARSRHTEKAGQEIRGAEDSLKKVPKISKELGEALGDAQAASSQALDASQKNDSPRMISSLDKAQDGIVRALESLQDEEQQDRDQQQEMDTMDQRSAQELITAQGVLDAGWRKLILDEISRLRSKGEPPDSSVLKFLESRLR